MKLLKILFRQLGVDHQQRRVDAGAGVLECALGQVVPRPAISSDERHEAAALQWSIGTNRDEASAGAEHRGGTFDVLDIHPMIERRIHQDAVEQADIATIGDQEIVSVDEPPREALLESRGELVIDLDGDAPYPGRSCRQSPS